MEFYSENRLLIGMNSGSLLSITFNYPANINTISSDNLNTTFDILNEKFLIVGSQATYLRKLNQTGQIFAFSNYSLILKLYKENERIEKIYLNAKDIIRI